MADEQKPNELIKIEQDLGGGISGFFARFTDDSTIIGSVCKNVVIPRLVDTAYEGLVAGLKKFFWGEDVKWSRGGGGSKNSSIIIGNHTPYNQMSANRSGPEPSKSESRIGEAISSIGKRKADAYRVKIVDDPSTGKSAWDIAQDIKESLEHRMDVSDGLISVADLYTVSGYPAPATSLDWGWQDAIIKIYHDLDDDKIVVVELPKPIDISKL